MLHYLIAAVVSFDYKISSILYFDLLRHFCKSGLQWVYQILLLPILTYAFETWTLLADNIKRLEAFLRKCQDHMQNIDISFLTDLGSVLDPVACHRSSLFGHGHVARLPEDTPAYQRTTPCNATSICHSVTLHTRVGGDEEVAWPAPQGQWYTHCCGHSGLTLRSSSTMH